MYVGKLAVEGLGNTDFSVGDTVKTYFSVGDTEKSNFLLEILKNLDKASQMPRLCNDV